MIKKLKTNDVVAVIAGNGSLPIRVIDQLKVLQKKHIVLSIEGFGPNGYETFPLGYIGEMLQYIHKHNAKKVVFCGGVKRPSIFKLKLDRVGKKWLRKLGMKVFLGDDSLLKGVRSLLEKEGLNVLGAQDILGTLLTPQGVLTRHHPSQQDLQDIARGIFVLNTLSKADVGQSVIIQEGVVLGIEAIEGTKKLIERCKDLKLHDHTGGVIVKAAKVNQDEQIDLPTIGPETIDQIINSKLNGIALLSGKTQIIDFEETVNKANLKKKFILGI